MSRPSRPLTEICGGQFAVVPAAACLDSNLENGPFRLYAALCSHADLDGLCQLSLKVLAKKLHVTARTIQTRKRYLEEQGWLEELHKGDKAIGTFRVTRNPSDRKEVQIRNAPKITDRTARKTPHAKRTAHPRCERDFAQNKSHQDHLVFPHEQNAVLSETDGGTGSARQGKPEGARPVVPAAPSRCVQVLNNRNQNNEPDLAGWARWLVSIRRLSDEQAWLWLINEIDRIAEEHGVDKEKAGRLLDQQLKIRRRAEQ